MGTNEIHSIQYADLAKALLGFIAAQGGPSYSIRPKLCYDPLADYFSLSDTERIRPRSDGYSGLMWEIRVQWTRQRLINQGLLDGSQRGWWVLTEAGVHQAKLLPSFQYFLIKYPKMNEVKTSSKKIKSSESNQNKLESDAINELVALGKEKGFLTYDDINKTLPTDITSSEEIDDVLVKLAAEQIDVTDTEASGAKDAEPLELTKRIEADELEFRKAVFECYYSRQYILDFTNKLLKNEELKFRENAPRTLRRIKILARRLRGAKKNTNMLDLLLEFRVSAHVVEDIFHDIKDGVTRLDRIEKDMEKHRLKNERLQISGLLKEKRAILRKFGETCYDNLKERFLNIRRKREQISKSKERAGRAVA